MSVDVAPCSHRPGRFAPAVAGAASGILDKTCARRFAGGVGSEEWSSCLTKECNLILEIRPGDIRSHDNPS